MKKWIALLLIFALCICFSACDTAAAAPTDATTEATEATEETTEPFDWNKVISSSGGSSCHIEDYSGGE